MIRFERFFIFCFFVNNVMVKGIRIISCRNLVIELKPINNPLKKYFFLRKWSIAKAMKNVEGIPASIVVE